MSPRTPVLLALLLLSACGDDGGGDPPDGVGALDCAWARGDNCFKRLVAASTACLPDAVQGALDATGSTCTSDAGWTVTFRTPVDPAVACTDSQVWDFAVTGPDGDTCLDWREGSTSVSIRTSAGTLRAEVVSGAYQVTCPDGSKYATSDPLSLLECLGDMPGHVISCSGDAISFSLSGSDAAPLAFTCAAPQG